MNNWEQTREFLHRFNSHVGYIYNQIDSKRNQKVFLSECIKITKACENFEHLIHNKIFIEQGNKLANLEKDGWFVYNKQMKKMAYITALDIVESIYKKMGKPV